MADGIRMTIDDKEFQRYLQKVLRALGTLDPVWRFTKIRMHNSITRNFQQGGRPNPWAKHKQSTKDRRGRELKQKGGTLRNVSQPILQEFGRLKLGIGSWDKPRKASYEYGFNESLKHIKKGVPLQEGISGWMEGRPFVLFQDSDVDAIVGFTMSLVFPDR